jgi:hypothetical protein
VIRRTVLAIAATCIVFAAGCKHHCFKKCNPCGDSGPPLPRSATNPYLLPPAGLPTTPAPAPNAGIPPVGPMDLRNYPPPGRPAPEVLLPDPIPGASSSDRSPGLPGYLGGPVKPTTEPPLSGGLPGYVRVKEGLATGRKPTLDGFESLKRTNFRTVIYLHAPGADLSAAKELASRMSLAFVAIETTPEKLGPAIEQFNGTAADTARHPIYVFDDDGVRAGALWYLHFRTADSMNDDAARVRARPLGLADDTDEAKAFAIATQRYLEKR